MLFAQNECCGKCLIGRLGTKKMLDILRSITNGGGQPGDMDLLLELSESMVLGSLCPLGGGAPGPVTSILKYFRDELEVHIKEHRCPAGVCQELTQ